MAKGILFTFLVAVAFLACDSHLADSPPPGFLKLSMTIDPGQFEVSPNDTLLLNIASIRLWKGAERREWAIVSDTNRTYNVFLLSGGNTVSISNKQIMYLPAADYTRLTVRVLAQDSVMILGGKRFLVRIPQEEYQIVNVDQEIRIAAGETIALKLIFEAEPSLTFQLGSYRLIPTFRLSH